MALNEVELLMLSEYYGEYARLYYKYEKNGKA